MAYIPEPRSNKDGSVTYRVRWREGVEQPAVAFCTRDLGAQALDVAERFKALVIANGDRMPTRDQLALYGLDWIVGVDIPNAATNSEPAPFVTVAETVRRYLDWLRNKASPPSARTLREYEGYLRRDIEPRTLGALDVATCEFEDIDNWQVELMTVAGPYTRPSKDPDAPPKMLSRNSVRKIRQSLLAPAFTYACSVRSGRPPLRARTSPVVDSEIVDPDAPFIRDYLETPDEYALFVKEAYVVDPNWARMTVTAAATGARHGEAVQLGPDAVNPRRHTLRFTERFSAGSVEDGRKNGDAGTIPVPEWITTRILLPAVSRGGPYLFIGPEGNRWSYATDWDRWDRLRARLVANGLHLHLTHHGMRKGYRTWLSSKKIEATKIDMVMGHRSGSIRTRYTDLTVADRAEIRAAVTELLPEHVWPMP